MIDVSREGSVATLRIAKSVTNPIDLDLVKALHAAVRELRENF